GTSLPDLIATIVEAGVVVSVLQEKLLRVGYDFRDAELYHLYKFKIREERMYEVDTNFPRIVSSSFVSGKLPPGILSLQYQIELASEPPFPLSEHEEATVIEGISRE